jgi:hypothetical protein
MLTLSHVILQALSIHNNRETVEAIDAAELNHETAS